MFNLEFVRNISDYDDFYIASKEKSAEQVERAEKLVKKIKEKLPLKNENFYGRGVNSVA